MAIALVKKLKITPKDNETSRALSQNAAIKTKELSKLKGAEFDKAYVDNEVVYHKAVDTTLENLLIPSATNAELKDQLKATFKTVQDHEQRAEQVAAGGRFKIGRAWNVGRPAELPDHAQVLLPFSKPASS